MYVLREWATHVCTCQCEAEAPSPTPPPHMCITVAHAQACCMIVYILRAWATHSVTFPDPFQDSNNIIPYPLLGMSLHCALV